MLPLFTGRDPDGNMTSAEPSRGEKEQDAEIRPTPLSVSVAEGETWGIPV